MSNPFAHKKQKYEEIDMTTARQMLDNVLDACNYERSTVPLEVLSSYSNYRRERYTLQKSLLIVMMLLFLLLPLLFIHAEIKIAPDYRDQDTRLWVSVPSFIPVSSISAEMNGKRIPVYEVDSHEYLVQPTENGTLNLSVRLLNRQASSASYTVTSVDKSAPAYVKSEQEGQNLLFFFSDSGTGVDGSSLRVTGEDDSISLPATWDDERCCVVLPYPDSVVHIYISDLAGNTLHLLITPQ